MPLAERERRTVVIGAVVLAAGVLLGKGVLPFADHWRRQEARLAAVRARVAQAEGLLAQGDSLEALAGTLERRLAGAPRRLIHGRTAAVAASALEGMLQGSVEASGAQLQRLALEPVAPGDAAEGVPVLRATLAATGDVVGLAQLLGQLADGARPVQVERLVVQLNPALRGAPDVLQWTLGVRTPVVVP